MLPGKWATGDEADQVELPEGEKGSGVGVPWMTVAARVAVVPTVMGLGCESQGETEKVQQEAVLGRRVSHGVFQALLLLVVVVVVRHRLLLLLLLVLLWFDMLSCFQGCFRRRRLRRSHCRCRCVLAVRSCHQCRPLHCPLSAFFCCCCRAHRVRRLTACVAEWGESVGNQRCDCFLSCLASRQVS